MYTKTKCLTHFVTGYVLQKYCSGLQSRGFKRTAGAITVAQKEDHHTALEMPKE